MTSIFQKKKVKTTDYSTNLSNDFLPFSSKGYTISRYSETRINFQVSCSFIPNFPSHALFQGLLLIGSVHWPAGPVELVAEIMKKHLARTIFHDEWITLPFGPRKRLITKTHSYFTRENGQGNNKYIKKESKKRKWFWKYKHTKAWLMRIDRMLYSV